jgi:hypothetical protein
VQFAAEISKRYGMDDLERRNIIGENIPGILIR